MLEGTYVVLAQTPVGSKRGEVTFSHGVNGALRAVLNVRGLNIALSGTISHVLMGKAPFTCTGSVEGDRLTATARSGSISISLSGMRKELSGRTA